MVKQLVSLLAVGAVVGGGAAGQERSDSAGRELSLEPERKVEFTTTEGTWISLDVDPSGESIVFELLGDLYRLPVGGGTAVPLVTGMPYDAQPSIAPSGEWIAFISDRDGSTNLWIAKADGSSPRKLSRETQNAVISPAWTPDSEYVIATVRGRRTSLKMYHVRGGSGIDVGASATPSGGGGSPGGGGPGELGAVVSPDGRFLYFARSAGTSGRGQFPMWQIARRDLRTGDVDVITQAEGSGIRPALSPDGRHLVYGTRYETQTGLRVRDLQTGGERWLVYPVQRDEQESGGAPSRDVLPAYTFSPDGESVFTTWDGKIQRVDFDTGVATEVPFEAGVSLDVGPRLRFPYRIEQGPLRARLVQDPRRSPADESLIFSVLTKLYVKDGQDAAPRRVTTGDEWEFKPIWSPDGRWIAYVTWATDGGHIWRIPADGSAGPERLTEHPAFYTDLVYSPDGERIVALRGNAYMRTQTFSEFGGLRIPLDLVWLPASGGSVELVAPARGLGAPHFASDPERIHVYSSDGLISLRFDGTDRRVHLKVTGPRNPRAPQPPPARSVLMHPGGKWALADVGNQLWVVAVPLSGGGPPTVSVRSPSVPAQRITDIGADYYGWSADGETVWWAIGSTYFERPFETVEFGREEAGEEASEEQEEGDAADEVLDSGEHVRETEVVLDFPRSIPSGTVVLRNATIVTMGEDGDIPMGDVIVTDNRIVAVGPSGTVNIPDGAREVDLSGRYILPGFIDTHAHWEFRTHDVLEPHNWSLVANLAYGVTAGLDVQTATNDYFAYQDLVETGYSIGQRAFMTGPGIFSRSDFQSYEATLAYLRRYKRHYRTPNIKSYMVGNRKQRQWVVRAAKELELMPTTEGGRDLMLDLTHAIDGFHGNEHTLPVTPLYEDVVQLYARTGIAYTPTLLVQYGGPIAEEYFYTRTDIHDDPKLNRFYPHNRLDEMLRRRSLWVRSDEFSFDEAAADAARIQRAGGLVGVGGHGQLQGLGYHWEMWALGMGGMTPREVLQAATIDGARIIGFEEDLGSLEAGKLADLVVLAADPLADIRNTNTVELVMKNGELYDGDTMNRIWPSERPLPPFWWWGAGPPKRP